MSLTSTRKVAMLGLILACSLPGCRSIGGVMGNPNAELRTGQWWAGTLPDMTPVPSQKRVAWVSFKNVTQAREYDVVAPDVLDILKSQGYQLTDDPNKAHLHVFYTLRYAGESAGDEGRALATGLGAVIGGGTGAAAAHVARAGAPATLGAGLGGALVGGITAEIMGNYGRVVEYSLIVDVRIAQRQAGAVKRQVTGVQAAQQTATDGMRQRSRSVDGLRQATVYTHQTLEETSPMLWQDARLVLWARQMRLQPQEAYPALHTAMVHALGQVLP